jgi:hypothetical protein
MQPQLFAAALNRDEAIALCVVFAIAIIGGVIVGVTKLVSDHFRKVQLDDMEATLKMEMIQRGMSAGDIKQVLEAKISASKSISLVDLGDAGFGLVGRAVEHALDLEEIVRQKKAKKAEVVEH